MRGFVAYAFALLKQAQGSKQRKEQYILSVLKREKAMNREILFKGKRLDNGKWVEGQLFKRDDEGTDGYSWCIADEPLWANNYSEIHGHYYVVPETVGQFTGLHDKSGKEIYEGDIVLATLKYFDIVNEKCRVIFHNGSFGVQYGFSTDYFKSFAAWDEIEVIGNIHDNPELLEVEK